MMSKISVIIPVYNTAEYLSECFDSIIAQTYGEFEVVIVDDGSTDNSSEICDAYQKKDIRFKVVHKTNEGVTKARETALKCITGDYLAFIDSDDTIESTMFEDMLVLAEQYTPDIIQSCSFRGQQKKELLSITEYTGCEALSYLLRFEKLQQSLCLGLYRRTLFDNYRFPSNIQFWEDFTINAELVSKAGKILTTSRAYYNYRDREGSATRVTINKKTLTCLRIADYLKSKDVFRSDKEYNNVKSYFIRFCYFHMFNKGLEEQVLAIIKREISDNIRVLFRAEIIPLKTKILMALFTIAPKLSCQITKILLRGLL